MKKSNVMALLIGAALFTGLGTVSLSAKCGNSMGSQAKKCGASMKGDKCGSSMKVDKCGSSMKVDKCGSSMKAKKCGASMKKATKKVMKCGMGKCGSK